MIETQRLVLKLMDEHDEQDILLWRNRKDIIDSFFSYKGITLKEHREWFERYVKDENRIEFIIKVKETDKKIGTVGLSSIDYRNQKAEFGILLGDSENRGNGYGKEASRAIINYGFTELNIQKISLKVFEDNKAAVNLYTKLGFQEEGVLKKEVFKKGKFKNVIIMAVFRDEWKVD